jgi:hypothetical protein
MNIGLSDVADNLQSDSFDSEEKENVVDLGIDSKIKNLLCEEYQEILDSNQKRETSFNRAMGGYDSVEDSSVLERLREGSTSNSSHNEEEVNILLDRFFINALIRKFSTSKT